MDFVAKTARAFGVVTDMSESVEGGSASMHTNGQLRSLPAALSNRFSDSLKDVDFDLMEEGRHRLSINSDLLNPTRRRKDWDQFFFTKSACGTRFSLFKESSCQFVLSAKVVDPNTITFAQVEHDPHYVRENEGLDIFVLHREKESSPLELYSTRECEMCDGQFGLGRCGPHGQPGFRQKLAIIKQHVVTVKSSNADRDDACDARVLDVCLPGFHDLKRDDRRDCWCERAKKMREEAARTALLQQNDPLSFGIDGALDSPKEGEGSIHGSDDGEDSCSTLSDDSKPKISLEGDEKSRPSRTKDPLPILMKSALPRWNLKYGTLVMDFQGTRVKLASSKNFLMYAPAHLGKKVPILQVGKAKKRRYHMDFRAPLSPIQAFAISVSSFIWKKDKKKTSK
jgi:hypothetical protein